MPLWEITEDTLARRPAAHFAELGIYERTDLQRLLRASVSALGEDLLVLSEEFGDWQDARRRIDLLALDRRGRLVVIELKRTDDGGHMELQALRYAAMVSSMGLDDVVDAYEAHCAKYRPDDDVDARSEVASFLETVDDDESAISSDVRIILVSADFGREITTTVLWLNGFEGMDVRCVRLVPYEVGEKIWLDIQQVLPLPEAADYQVKLRRKEKQKERVRADGRDFTRYHIIVEGTELPDQNKRNAIRVMIEQLVAKGVALEDVRSVLPARAFRVFPGHLGKPDAILAALSADGVSQPERFFVNAPMYDAVNDRTYVFFKMWGRNTEPTLTLLSEQWPDAKVSFRAAE